MKINFYEVAIITPKYIDFFFWIKQNKKDNEIYTWIFKLDKVLGKKFDRIEKLYNYQEVQDIDEILYYLERHLKYKL